MDPDKYQKHIERIRAMANIVLSNINDTIDQESATHVVHSGVTRRHARAPPDHRRKNNVAITNIYTVASAFFSKFWGSARSPADFWLRH